MTSLSNLYNTSTNHYIGLPIGRQIHLNNSIVNNYESVKNLADEMEYLVEQRNGQRFFGPPLNWKGPIPTIESEVFVGCIPRNMYEDYLIPMLCSVGKLYQFRLMMDFNGNNRGYGFAMYSCTEEAQDACRILNNFPVTLTKSIAVIMCNNNNSLYVGGFTNKSPFHIINTIYNNTSGVTNISITVPDHFDRRYAIVNYDNHRNAALARRFLQVSNYKLWEKGSSIIVDWLNRHKINLPIYVSFKKGADKGGIYHKYE